MTQPESDKPQSPEGGRGKVRMTCCERIGSFFVIFLGIYLISLTFSLFYWNISDPSTPRQVTGIIEKHVDGGLYIKLSNNSVYTKILNWPDFKNDLYPITAIMSFYSGFVDNRSLVKNRKVGEKLIIYNQNEKYYVNNICKNVNAIDKCKEIITSFLYYYTDVCMTWTFNLLIIVSLIIVVVILGALALSVCLIALGIIVWSCGACITGDPDFWVTKEETKEYKV